MAQSVVRVLRVIEALNLRRVTSLETLRAATGVPKPTLVRLLRDLIDAGYAYQVSRKEGYALASGVLRLSAGVRHRDLLVDVARPLMEVFTREQKWQLSLATFEDGGMLIRATTRHVSPYAREQITLNRRIPVLTTALGRAYFAANTPHEREMMLQVIAESDARDAAVASEPELVDEIIGRVRDDGYANIHRRDSERHDGLAVAIIDRDDPGSVLGAIVMRWYRSVMSERRAAQTYLEALNNLSHQIADQFASAREVAAAAAAPEPPAAEPVRERRRRRA